MKFNYFVIYILFLLFVPFQSCSKAPKSSEVESAELLQILADSLQATINAEVKKANCRAEFDGFIKESVLRFYSGHMEGNTILVKENNTLYGEAPSPLLYITIVASNPQLFENVSTEIAFIYEEMGEKYLKIYDISYKVTEVDDVAFESHNNLDYTIYTLNRTKESEPDENRNNIVYTYNYIQSFVPIRKTSLYDKVFDSDIFLDITLSEDRTDISKWTHNLKYETVETDETLSDNWSSSTTTPFRFDSTVFVLCNTLEVYLGGAHEMLSTTVYNFDVETGKLLKLSDIIDDDANEFKTILKEAVLREYDKEIGDERPSTFTIYRNGIEFTFPPYSLDGGSWETNVFLSYDELQNVLIRKLYPVENS